MINIKIYCTKQHQDYQTTYDVINKVMMNNNLDFVIKRITEPKAIALQHIVYEPHIVINSFVVYTKGCPSEKEMENILHKLKIIY